MIVENRQTDYWRGSAFQLAYLRLAKSPLKSSWKDRSPLIALFSRKTQKGGTIYDMVKASKKLYL